MVKSLHGEYASRLALGICPGHRSDCRPVAYARASKPVPEPDEAPRESYVQRGGQLLRLVLRGNGTVTESVMGAADYRLRDPSRLQARADGMLLRGDDFLAAPDGAASISVVDLFSGIGALSWGVIEGARAVGLRADIVLAADVDPAPLKVLEDSLKPLPGAVRCLDIGEALAGTGRSPTEAERAFLNDCPDHPDILVAGPPCQGHSRLNNHTRHDDARNDLYGRVVRFVELRRPRLVIIENVDTVTADQRGNAAAARLRLEALKYSVSEGTVHLNRLGVPQRRRRHLLVATRPDQPSLDVSATVRAYAVSAPQARTVRWAIGDLVDAVADGEFGRPSTPVAQNERRLGWFGEHPGVLDLPNAERPDCHRVPKQLKDGTVKEHTYRSMYGRLDGDAPAQTITSGFGSMGQGRYVHPDRLRTLTPHEAARLQFVGDAFDFSSVVGRGRLARMIGNVAPMKLAYPFVVELLR